MKLYAIFQAFSETSVFYVYMNIYMQMHKNICERERESICMHTHTWNENIEFKIKPTRKILCLKTAIDVNGLLFWHISEEYSWYKWLRQTFCIAALKTVNHKFNLYQG